MNILIIGAGKIGQKIISAMSLEKHNITVIDTNEKSLSEINTNSRIKTVAGSGLDRQLLKKLNIEEFDYVLSLTRSDKMNILISTMTKNLGAKYTIALIEQVDSIDELFYLSESLGIDYIVNPDVEISRAVEGIIKNKIVYQADKFSKGKIELVGHYVEIDSEFEGEKIKNIGNLATILVVAILRGSELIIPDGETVIQRNDYLYLIGLAKDILSFKTKYLCLEPQIKNKNIVIAGGNIITDEIANMAKDYNITVIEEDYKKAKELRRKYPNLFILRKDYKEENFFEDVEFETAEIFIALTENDELNVVMGMMAKKMNIGQVIIKLQTTNYLKIVENLNITAALSSVNITADKVLDELREGKNISDQLVFNGEAEVVEIKLDDGSELIGKLIKDLDIPKAMLIGGIARLDGTAVIPRGSSRIEQGDTLVIFYKLENRRQLERFINPKENKGFIERLLN